MGHISLQKMWLSLINVTKINTVNSKVNTNVEKRQHHKIVS